MGYARHLDPRTTPQSEAVDARQALNSAGGYTFVIDDFARLRRFLILGSEGGTYYADERKLTRDNAACLGRCLSSDGSRTIAEIVDVSERGIAPKNDSAVFALAYVLAHGDEATRRLVPDALPRVCRIGTHLFQFIDAYTTLHGKSFGRVARRALAGWYAARTAEELAFQVAKYQQRETWCHRDVVRLSHPLPASPRHAAVLQYAIDGVVTEALAGTTIEGMHEARAAWSTGGVRRLCSEIVAHKLPFECVPSEALGEAAVWEALLPNLGLTAILRNLGRMTSNGTLRPLSAALATVAHRFNPEAIRRARLHPLTILLGLATYASGHGGRGSLSWQPLQQIAEILNEAFYASFEAIEPTGKRFLLAVDCSGSMGATASGSSLSCRTAAAAMAMAIARREPQHHIVGFTSASGWRSRDSGLTPLALGPSTRLDEAVRIVQRQDFGATDCSLPFTHALAEQVEVDCFVVLTDNETWAGKVHPHMALREYRMRMGIPARSVVLAMTATQFSIADPTDPGMLDISGLSADVPALVSSFAKGSV